MVSKPELRMIAERDGFMLCDTGLGRGGWVNLKLMRAAKHRSEKKWNWHLAWNGERLSQSRDAKLLEQYHPETHCWVIATLTSALPMQPVQALETWPEAYCAALGFFLSGEDAADVS